MKKQSSKPRKPNRYSRIVTTLFERHFRKGVGHFDFTRPELIAIADELEIKLPKNVGDVIYSFRYRNSLPENIVATAENGREWIILGAGIAKYTMRQVRKVSIVPQPNMMAIKIPEATPEIISRYAQGDEQALLAKVRYNRLIDIFLGAASYSLQNHLRTTVQDIGQIEIDEIYVAVDKSGVQYAVPVQAKGGKDIHSLVQTWQDMACCAAKFPSLQCRPVSAQFMKDGTIAMFELTMEKYELKIVQERHYILVPADQIGDDDLAKYRMHKS